MNSTGLSPVFQFKWGSKTYCQIVPIFNCYNTFPEFPVYNLLSIISYRKGQYLNIYNGPYLCKAVDKFTNVITSSRYLGYLICNIKGLFSLVRLWHSSQYPGALQLLRETFVNSWCSSKELVQSRGHLLLYRHSSWKLTPMAKTHGLNACKN